MDQNHQVTAMPESEVTNNNSGMHRRNFLKIFGGTAAAAVVVASCDKDDDDNDTGIDLGSGDVGILNYAYALEQLEAAFYTQVIATPYTGITAVETEYLTDIRDHEVAHRNFFKAAITAAGATPVQDLVPNFSSVNFTSRDSVLGTAKAFEDLGVSAYNGAGKLIANVDYLLIAGKIVSVEARHAALIRDLISNGSFADSSVINGQGLDVASTPRDVVATANQFLNTKISARNLPTS